jgi:hypothetical protein
MIDAIEADDFPCWTLFVQVMQAGRPPWLRIAKARAGTGAMSWGVSFPRSRPWLQLQVKAKAAWRRQGEEVRFAADSPLEGTGFEPSVPL